MEATMNAKKKNNAFSVQMKMNIVRYIVVCGFLTVVNYITSPHYWWVLWVIAGWGINLGLSLASSYLTKKEEEVR